MGSISSRPQQPPAPASLTAEQLLELLNKADVEKVTPWIDLIKKRIKEQDFILYRGTNCYNCIFIKLSMIQDKNSLEPHHVELIVKLLDKHYPGFSIIGLVLNPQTFGVYFFFDEVKDKTSCSYFDKETFPTIESIKDVNEVNGSFRYFEFTRLQQLFYGFKEKLNSFAHTKSPEGFLVYHLPIIPDLHVEMFTGFLRELYGPKLIKIIVTDKATEVYLNATNIPVIENTAKVTIVVDEELCDPNSKHLVANEKKDSLVIELSRSPFEKQQTPYLN